MTWCFLSANISAEMLSFMVIKIKSQRIMQGMAKLPFIKQVFRCALTLKKRGSKWWKNHVLRLIFACRSVAADLHIKTLFSEAFQIMFFIIPLKDAESWKISFVKFWSVFFLAYKWGHYKGQAGLEYLRHANWTTSEDHHYLERSNNDR